MTLQNTLAPVIQLGQLRTTAQAQDTERARVQSMQEAKDAYMRIQQNPQDNEAMAVLTWNVPQVAQQIQNQMQARNEAELQAKRGSLFTAAEALKADNLPMFQQSLVQAFGDIPMEGQDSSIAQQIYDVYRTEGVDAALDELRPYAASFGRDTYDELYATPSDDRFILSEGQIQYDGQGNVIASNISEGADIETIRSEVRNDLRKNVPKVLDQADSITTNYNKIGNLLQRIENGDRQATYQAFVALVKLGDPGVAVTPSEAEGALNTETPVASVLSLLSGKGVPEDVQRAIVASVDPLSPDNVNAESLKATAGAIASASIPTIIENYNRFSTAGRRQLTGAGYDSIFSDETDNKVSALETLIGGQTDQPLPDLRTLSDEELLSQL